MNHETQTERLYAILSDGKWHTTKELAEATGITRVAARIWDLRKGNANHKAWPIESKTENIDGTTWKAYRITKAFGIVAELAALKEQGKRMKVEEQPTLWAYDRLTHQP